MVESALDEVPGLGEIRRKALLTRFGSLKRLRAASVDEIAEVPGIGRSTAASVVGALSLARPGAGDPGPGPAEQPPVNTATGEILDDEPAGGRS